MATQTAAEVFRDVHPRPEWVFAQFHWHDRYATSGLGTYGFWQSLTVRERKFCLDAIERIELAQKEHA